MQNDPSDLNYTFLARKIVLDVEFFFLYYLHLSCVFGHVPTKNTDFCCTRVSTIVIWHL